MSFLSKLSQKPKDAVPVEKMTLDLALDSESSHGLQKQAFNLEQHYTVGQGDPRTQYERRQDKFKMSIKWGQLKLLLTELDFLTRYWDPEVVEIPQIVSVGAALGTHTILLSKLFPQAQFHLYDPRDFDKGLENLPNVQMYKQFFTDEDAQKWSGRSDVYFMCDIRQLEYDRGDLVENKIELAKKNEEIVWGDMLMQQGWIFIMKPVKSYIKFRLPYSYDFTLKEGDSRPYLDGLVYRQPWAPQTSTECRLVPYDDLRKRDWDFKAHEEMMFYHNTTLREQTLFKNPLTGDDALPAPKLGLTSDYDSVLTLVIAQGYLNKFGIDPTPQQVYTFCSQLIQGANRGRTTLIGLRSGIHQHYFDGPEDEEES
jgi:hypothetical protein